MKKIGLLLLFTLFVSVNLFSQDIKKSVCIVERHFTEKTSKLLKDCSYELKRNGFSKISEYLTAYEKGGFGSGFVVVRPNGEKVILSNTHVVQGCDYVTIKFLQKDGTYEEFKDVKILDVADHIDLSMIEFPKGCSAETLSIVNEKSLEGSDVYTAGFPALGNEPAWQLGKGIVTNDYTVIKDLTNDYLPFVIQHSAQIDSGNSGGPLLIKKDNVYKVVGINTWKAVFRESTNFSIPSEIIQKYLAKPADYKENSKDVDLFNSIISEKKEEDFKKLATFVPDEIVEKYGIKALLNVLNTAYEKNRTIVIDTLGDNPIEAMRQAAGYVIYKYAVGKKVSCKNEEEINTLVKEVFEKNREYNRKDVTEEDRNSKVFNPYKYTFNCSFGVDVKNFTFLGDSDFYYGTNFFNIGGFISAELMKVQSKEVRNDNDLYSYSSRRNNKEDCLVAAGGLLGGAQYPLNLGSMYFIPFVNAKLGYGKTVNLNEIKSLLLGADVGFELVLPGDSLEGYSIGCKYSADYYPNIGYSGQFTVLVAFKFVSR